jgi:hypothetical protein
MRVMMTSRGDGIAEGPDERQRQKDVGNHTSQKYLHIQLAQTGAAGCRLETPGPEAKALDPKTGRIGNANGRREGKCRNPVQEGRMRRDSRSEAALNGRQADDRRSNGVPTDSREVLPPIRQLSSSNQ